MAGVALALAGVTLALAGCASHGGAGATTGAIQTTDGGSKLLPGEKCGANATCGTGTKTYQSCTVAGASCSERFLTSDGQSYDCASCTDCKDAAAMVTTWCGGSMPNNDAACAMLSSNTDCTNCCATNHSAGNTFLNNAVADCECNGTGSCAIECEASLCMGTDADSTCGQCVQEDISFGECDETTKCMSNTDCSALLDCANACPQ